MNNPVYFLISIIIGTSIILLFTRLSNHASDENIELLYEEILMRNFITTQEILEHHLKKIGFKVAGNSIIEADSNRIKFICDENQDGITDVIEIKMHQPALNTENPLDHSLIVLINDNQEIINQAGITKFNLEYFDVNGNPINEKMFIRTIRVTLRLESETSVNGKFLFYENQFLIRPKNLV